MSVRIAAYVTPRSGCDEVAGWRRGELYLKVTVPPEAGKANAAACKLVAKALHVPKSRVRVVRGETSRHKQLEVDGIDDEQVSALLGPSGAE